MQLQYIHLSNANKCRCGIFIVLSAAMPCVYRQHSSLIACNVKTVCHMWGVNHPYRVTEMKTIKINLFPAVQDSHIFIYYILINMHSSTCESIIHQTSDNYSGSDETVKMEMLWFHQWISHPRWLQRANRWARCAGYIKTLEKNQIQSSIFVKHDSRTCMCMYTYSMCLDDDDYYYYYYYKLQLK